MQKELKWRKNNSKIHRNTQIQNDLLLQNYSSSFQEPSNPTRDKNHHK